MPDMMVMDSQGPKCVDVIRPWCCTGCTTRLETRLRIDFPGHAVPPEACGSTGVEPYVRVKP